MDIYELRKTAVSYLAPRMDDSGRASLAKIMRHTVETQKNHYNVLGASTMISNAVQHIMNVNLNILKDADTRMTDV